MEKKYLPFFLALLLLTVFAVPALAQENLKLVINGESLTYSPGPIIQNGRTMVPIRIISEKLGASVTWDEISRKVLIEKNGKSVSLKIDSKIFELQPGSGKYDVVDSAPVIISDRTFVPLRLISNVLGVGINWSDSTRTVTVDSSTSTTYSSYSDFKISLTNNQNTITGKTQLQLSSTKIFPDNASEIRYYLLDKENRSGTMIARGSAIGGSYTWLPETEKQGEKLVFAALYDKNGSYIGGGVLSVNVRLQPKVSINSPTSNSKITGNSIAFTTDLNFAPKYIKYEFSYLDREKVFSSGEADPYGPYNWSLMAEDNGNVSVKAIAYDNNNIAYESPSIQIEVALEKKLTLGGTKSGNTIQNPVNLFANRNFHVSETQYLLRDPLTQKETILTTVGYTAYKWFPKPEDSGNKELYVRVKDTGNRSFTSPPLYVTILGSPKLILEGIGPNQVITGTTKIKGISNVELTDYKLYLVNPSNNSKKLINANGVLGTDFSWTPSGEDAGSRSFVGEGYYQGQKISSESISLNIYLGTIYTAKPITAKSNFQNFASQLALNSAQTTGMSPALQTAQAILETGWGQSVPVDKYTGTFSYNLFGIKGKGPAGSVTSNTWEEYNGTVFRIDAAFRAYSNVNQSWDDHKNLLLNAQRYSIFRDVMYSSTQGAWALRRAGYATDSQYPIKLINIINTYNLNKLDESSF